MTRIGMLLDTDTCIGCLACTTACRVEHNNPAGVWMAPVPELEIGVFPDVSRVHLPLMCLHCEDAACVTACPTGAISRRPDGIVVIDGDVCCGSGACVIACPHGAITLPQLAATHFDEATPFEVAKGDYFPPGTAQKCDMCVDRIDEGLQPACVDACPTGSRIFGDLDDPESEIAKRMAAEETTVLGTGAFTNPTVRHTVKGARAAGGGLEVFNLPFQVQTLWDLHHAVEFLLLGIGGGLALLALFAGDRLLQLIGGLFVMAGGLVLVSDLTRPMRFLLALRNQRTSWLSRGAIANFAFLGLVFLSLVRPVDGQLLPVAIALIGVFVMAYPGLALASYAGVRSWHTWLVPVSFVVDGIAAGLGIAAIAQLFTGGGSGGLALGLLALAAVRIALLQAFVVRLKQGEPAAMNPALENLHSGPARQSWRVGVVGVGFVGAAALALLGLALGGVLGGIVTAAAGVCTVAGSFAAKLVVLRTGAKPVQGAPVLGG